VNAKGVCSIFRRKISCSFIYIGVSDYFLLSSAKPSGASP